MSPISALPSNVTAAELMRLLGVTRPRITQLEADGIVTRTGRNQYSIESVPRYVDWLRRGHEGPAAWNRARTRLAEERALAARQVRLEREGRLLPRDTVETLVGAVFRTVRDGFLGLGARLAPQLHAARSLPAVQNLIDERTREILSALAETEVSEVVRRIDEEAARRAKRVPVTESEVDDEQQAG
jgi:phage terminase Nu1 subunit (DNA packaging protein)